MSVANRVTYFLEDFILEDGKVGYGGAYLAGKGVVGYASAAMRFSSVMFLSISAYSPLLLQVFLKKAHGIAVVDTFHLVLSKALFAQGNKDFEQIKTLGYYAMAAFNTSTRLFDGLMYLVVILAGGLSLVYGRITAGDMVAYMLS